MAEGQPEDAFDAYVTCPPSKLRLIHYPVDPSAEVIREFGSPHMTRGHCADNGAKTYLRVRFTLRGVDDFYVGTKVELKVRER